MAFVQSCNIARDLRANPNHGGHRHFLKPIYGSICPHRLSQLDFVRNWLRTDDALIGLGRLLIVDNIAGCAVYDRSLQIFD